MDSSLRSGLISLMTAIAVGGGATVLASTPSAYVVQAQLDLGGDSSTAMALGGGLAGNGRIPGGESHAFVYQNGAMTDLGTFGGIRSSAGLVDNAGNVLGVSQTVQGINHAFVYQNGNITDLGNEVGAQWNSAARGIDSAGQILISYFGAGNSGRAGLLQNGQFSDIGTLGGSITRAFGFNPAGEVVGSSYTDASNLVEAAFVYTGGVMTGLSSVPGVLATASYSEADGVSSGGIVGGTYYAAQNSPHRAFIYQNGKTTDLGTLGGSSAEVSYVAANGNIYGDSTTASGVAHAFSYINGTITDLGSLAGISGSSYAAAANSTGLIVGTSGTSVTGQSRAVIFGNQTVTDLGTLGGTSASAVGVNASGSIIGSSLLADNKTSNAFLYQNGSVTNVGTLGGVGSRAASINDSGVIVGSASTAGGQNRAFTYTNGQVVAIPTLGGAVSQANGANASGSVVGYSQIQSGEQHAFVYQGGVVTDLNPLLGGSSSTATGITPDGVIAGTYQPAGADTSHQHAFIDRSGTITDLGTLGQAASSAIAINAKGDIAGQLSSPNMTGSAFLYASGKMTNIDPYSGDTVVAINDNDQVLLNSSDGARVNLYSNGTLTNLLPADAIQSSGAALNGSGDVVGTYNTLSRSSSDGFLYRNGTFTDLNALLGLAGDLRPTDINNAGDILGSYSDPAGGGYAFLYSNGSFYDLNTMISGLPPGWTVDDARFYPGTSNILAQAFEGSRATTFLLAVPEPKSGGTVLFALGGLGLISRRRRADNIGGFMSGNQNGR